MAENLVNTFADLKEKEVLKIVESRLNTAQDPLEILNEMRIAMEIIGKRFAANEYFISELIYSAEIMKTVTEMVKPKLVQKEESKCLDKIIIGTVAGDIHNIGKDIVVFMLEANGFRVYDLGVDVPSQKFVEKIKETNSPIIGLSGLLTTAFDAMKDTIEAIKIAGFQDEVKIMIGGNQVDEKIRNYTNADAYGKDAMSAVYFAKEWVRGK